MAHHPNNPHPHSHTAKKPKAIHKDWRAWTAVILMLAAMAVYVLSMDESIEPGGVQQDAFEAMDAE